MQLDRLTAALALGGCFLVLPQPTAAQQWQLDMGGNSVAYDTTGYVRSASIAPLLAWQRRAAYATLGGAFAEFAASQWTSQGHGDLSVLFAPAGEASRFRTEVVGAVDGSVHSGGYRAAASRGELRLHVVGRSAGFWAGGTAVTGWTSSSTGITSALGPTAGVWGRRQAWNLSVAWMPYRLEGYWFNEAQGRASTSIGRVDLTAYLGGRRAPSAAAIPNTAWGGGTLAVWFTPQVALVLGAGTYPSDLLQTLPKGSYLSAAIRLSRHRPPTWAPASTGHALYAAARGASELRFAVPGASRVDLVGDWTGWQAVPLQRAADGRWVVRVRLEPGVHRFNLVVDGQRWIAPEGSAAVDDGFGGKTSLLVVP